MTDSDLLRQFIEGSDHAFAELVHRYIDPVYAAALRHVGGNRQSAEDITQKVFIDLARKARTLTGHPTLAGWLYSSTRYIALSLVRREQRRMTREKQYDAMETVSKPTDPGWEQIKPVIDDALQELDETDRQSILLRFFGQQPFATIGSQLGISENAAQKRVDRALDQLNGALKRRGIFSTAAAVGLALAESGAAAPVELAATVTSAALAGAAGLSVSSVALASVWKVAAASAVVGVIGWMALRQSGPMTDRPGSSPPKQGNAKPANEEKIESREARVVAEAPKPIEPTSTRRPEPTNTQPAAVSTPSPAPKIYVVAPGDTLKRIAGAVGVTPEAVRAENPNYNFARMRVGEYVTLPASAILPGSPGEPTPVVVTSVPADHVYVVQPGDTLLKIAQKRDLLPGELEALNPETDWQRLRVGQRIRAP